MHSVLCAVDQGAATTQNVMQLQTYVHGKLTMPATARHRNNFASVTQATVCAKFGLKSIVYMGKKVGVGSASQLCFTLSTSLQACAMEPAGMP